MGFSCSFNSVKALSQSINLITAFCVSHSRLQVISNHVHSYRGLSPPVSAQTGKHRPRFQCGMHNGSLSFFGQFYWFITIVTHCCIWQGVLLSKLVEDFFNMKEEILSRDFDLGFSGNSEDVVMHALSLLGNCVNVTSTNKNTEFIIAPSNTVPALFELNFYSNGLFHVFIGDAIIGKRSETPQVINLPF